MEQENQWASDEHSHGTEPGYRVERDVRPEAAADILLSDDRRPTSARGAWAEQYRVERYDDCILYRRDGLVKIVDRGSELAFTGDERTTNDVMRLAKEQGIPAIDPATRYQDKQRDIMMAAYRNNVTVRCNHQPAKEENLRAAVRAVEIGRAQESRGRERGHEREQGGQGY